ncbi:putative DNA-binding transcriptional regulator AlpA [Nocardioides sp. HB32]
MKSRHKLGTSAIHTLASRRHTAWPRLLSARPAHLRVMETTNAHPSALEAVLTISGLAADLGVSVQAIYDLRSQGRGPRGFRVGRELRFRISEVEAWLAGLEDADQERHPRRSAP